MRAILVALLCLTYPALHAQTRTDAVLGVSLTLPEGWKWAEDGEDSLEATNQLSVEGARGLLVCNLKSAQNPFVGMELNGIRLMVDREPMMSGCVVAENQKLGGQSGVFVASFRQDRKGGGTGIVLRRWVVDRSPKPVVWFEQTPADLVEHAEDAWTALRKGLKITKVKGEKIVRKRTYVEQKARFQLPKGWMWTKGARGPKVRLNDSQSWQTLFGARTCIIEEGRGHTLSVYLATAKTGETPNQFFERNRENLRKNVEDVQDNSIAEATFRGKKAVRLAYTGLQKGGNKQRLRWDHFVFKHKGRLFHWQEITEQPSAITRKIREKGRRALGI